MKQPLEARYPCPVCVGVTQEKQRFDLPRVPSSRAREPGELVLDHCARCGGVWFGHGEVQLLRKVDPQTVWASIVRREGVHRMQCHNCQSHIERNRKSCAACGWNVSLDCPACDRPMQHAFHDGINLDVCRSCKGVWFDHDELELIWKLQVNALVAKRKSALNDAGMGSLVVLDALTYDPFLAYYGIQVAGHAIGGAVQALTHIPGALANVPEAAGGLAEAAGEIASSVFETIAEIIGGLFG
jgi:Zn-finger nucleic acid-binding protein